jgi:hypothetical protein
MKLLVHVLERPIKEKIGMRILTLNLLAVALLLFGATSASAYAINMAARGSTSSLVTNDTVTVDVFLDAEPGLSLLSVAVLASSDAVLDYSAVRSGAAPANSDGSAGPGGQPTYILYTGGKGATVLYPQQTPVFLNWPAPPPGEEQVNINWAENALGSATASGTGIWIATLVFDVATGFASESLSLSLDAGGNVLEAPSGNVIPSSDVGLSAPILLTGASVPEPTTAMLIGLGIVGLAAAGRRRA